MKSDNISYFQAEGETEVLVPGDPEASYIRLCEERGGVHLLSPDKIKYVSIHERMKSDNRFIFRRKVKLRF